MRSSTAPSSAARSAAFSSNVSHSSSSWDERLHANLAEVMSPRQPKPDDAQQMYDTPRTTKRLPDPQHGRGREASVQQVLHGEGERQPDMRAAPENPKLI